MILIYKAAIERSKMEVVFVGQKTSFLLTFPMRISTLKKNHIALKSVTFFKRIRLIIINYIEGSVFCNDYFTNILKHRN